MPTKTLTDRNVKTLPAVRGERTTYFDAIVSGLELRVSPSGARTYSVRYRVKGEDQPTRYTIGDATRVTLAKAREEARRVLALVELGGDPHAERQEKIRAKRHAMTLSRVAEGWLTSRDAEAWRPSTRREFERITRKVIVPRFGNRDPNVITRGEARKFLDDIAEDAPVQANRVFAIFRLLYEWAHKDRQEHLGVTGHPLAGMEKPAKEQPRTRTYSNDEIRRIIAGVKGTELADLVPLILHTATRSEETRALRWADVDWERNLWTIPPEASKTGEARGEVHPVPLSTGALGILRRIRESKVQKLSPFVFQASTSTGYMNQPNKHAGLVRTRSGVEDFTLHDLRRTVSQRLEQDLGVPGDVVEAVLGHARPRLKRTYVPVRPFEEQRQALERWNDALAAILKGKTKRA